MKLKYSAMLDASASDQTLSRAFRREDGRVCGEPKKHDHFSKLEHVVSYDRVRQREARACRTTRIEDPLVTLES